MNRETDWILEGWESVLTDLPKGPEAVIGRVDWASKYWMLNEFKNEENLEWNDPWLKSLDLEYHNLNKETGLFWGLEANGDGYRKTTDEAVEFSKVNPPRGTRAQGRGELIKRLMSQHAHMGYLIDWIGFRLSKTDEPFLMLDPFISYKEEIIEHLNKFDPMPQQEIEQGKDMGSPGGRGKNRMNDCLFCKISKGSIPSAKVYESDTLFAINDINPQAPTHILIIPRIHQDTLLDVEEKDHALMGSVISVANQLAKEKGIDKSGFRLVVNCGAGAGQSVFHIHFHLLGGRAMTWPPG